MTAARRNIQTLVATVCAYLGVPQDAFDGKTRIREVVHARWAVIAVLRRRGWAYARIGRAVGKNHGTVIHAMRNLKKLPPATRVMIDVLSRTEPAPMSRSLH